MAFDIRLIVIIALFFLYCAPDRPNNGSVNSNAFSCMVKINSTGKSFIQGANDSLSGSDEKPTVVCSFSYDYWLDTTEVTQSAYKTITGKNPSADSSIYGLGDDYPVYNVSWFDAVLFCNAKSKLYSLDTVYTYYSVSKLASGGVYDLTGLRTNYDRNGFRLPTEAEWEFAAREGISNIPFSHLRDSNEVKTFAWYDGNSAGSTHPVAQLTPNSFGLYDMAGNVFEWTGDWKCGYCVSAIENSLGAPQPNSGFEKVLKGGSFNNPFVKLRPSRRSATYPTSASSATYYVGFRCARAVISNGGYMTATTSTIATNPVDLVKGDIQSCVGSNQAKLVFVNVNNNLRTLCYVDFNEAHPRIHEIVDSTNINVPVISPDGNYVVYSTRGEGLSGMANGYIRALTDPPGVPSKIEGDSVFVPRFWVDKQSGDTFCVYTNSAIDDNNTAWTVTQTFMQKISGGIPVGSRKVFISDGGFHDGISADGRYSVTGYTKLLLRDIDSNQAKQLFIYPNNGKSSLGSTQVCNVSMTPDTFSNNRCMFLDFGCQTTSTLTNCSYNAHEYIFITSFSDNVVSWYKSPDQEQSWDFPEWSNAPRFAVSCASNSAGDAHAVYMLDLDTKIPVKLVEGITLANPGFWIRPSLAFSSELSLDSLGRYNDPPLSDVQKETAYKLILFWKMHKDLEIAIVGDSRANEGIDPAIITDYKTINFAIGGTDRVTTEEIVRDYILPHCPKLKVIVMNLNFANFCEDVIGGSWTNGIALSKGYNYDKNHNFWKDGIPQDFEKIISLINQDFTGDDSLGWRPILCYGWGTATTPAGETLLWDTSNNNYKKYFNSIAALIRDVTSAGVHVVFVELPMSPLYAKGTAYMMFGPSQSTAIQILSQIKNIGDSNPLFHFYDAHNNGNHDYTDTEACDEDHLCYRGAMRFGDSLNAIIQGILVK